MKKHSSNPRYFLAVFGEKYANKHPVDGECYPVPRPYCPAAISENDKIVLFCLLDYPRYGWTVPGIGEVTQREDSGDDVYVHYRYKPIDPPIGRNALMDCLDDEETKQLKYPRLKCYWLREIKQASFNCIVRERRVELS